MDGRASGFVIRKFQASLLLGEALTSVYATVLNKSRFMLLSVIVIYTTTEGKQTKENQPDIRAWILVYPINIMTTSKVKNSILKWIFRVFYN